MQLQFTRLSKVLSGVLVLLWLLQWLVPDTAEYLSLVPARVLPLVWTVGTWSFVCPTLLELGAAVAGVLSLARLVEPVHGTREFLLYILFVDVVLGCLVFLSVYVAFAATTDAALLYARFAGFHGVLAALLVAVKQVMPLHDIKLLGSAFRLKVTNLPSVVLVVVAALSTVLRRLDFLSIWVAGTYVGWLYLRFIQKQAVSGQSGDSSEEFKFSSFFPAVLEPAIDAVAFAAGRVTRLYHGPGAEGARGQGVRAALAGVGPSVLGTDEADASRRRERGAKALEERLGLKKGPGGDGDLEGGVLPASENGS